MYRIVTRHIVGHREPGDHKAEDDDPSYGAYPTVTFKGLTYP